MASADDFEEVLTAKVKEIFGNCRVKDGVLRVFIEHLGVVDSNVILELAIEPGLHKEAVYPILHAHCTIAQGIDKEDVPFIVNSLNELNTCISVGAFPAFGCFGYYAPLQQIYLSYRLPFNTNSLDTELENIEYYLCSLYEQLDVFTDFILFICDHPKDLTLEEYMTYLDSIADLYDLEEKTRKYEALLEETAEKVEKSFKAAGITDEEINKAYKRAQKDTAETIKELEAAVLKKKDSNKSSSKKTGSKKINRREEK